MINKVDSKVFESLIENEGLIFKVALDLNNGSLPFIEVDDLASAGKFAFIEAFPYYDKSKGASFSSYMYSCIRKGILKAYQTEIRRKKTGRIAFYLEDSLEDGLTRGDFIYSDLDVEDKVLTKIERENNTRLVKEVLSNLKDEDKEFFNDYYVKEKKLVEISRELNKPKSTVTNNKRYFLNRCMKVIKKRELGGF